MIKTCFTRIEEGWAEMLLLRNCNSSEEGGMKRGPWKGKMMECCLTEKEWSYQR